MRGLGGDVIRADVMTDQGGRSRGCGIVEFADPDQASQAIEQLNNSELKGRMIFVREVRSCVALFYVLCLLARVESYNLKRQALLGAAEDRAVLTIESGRSFTTMEVLLCVRGESVQVFSLAHALLVSQAPVVKGVCS